MEPVINTPTLSHDERRRYIRSVCSVLSQVFVMSGDTRRYLGPGVILDISDGGLALMVDQLPAHDTLVITNAYFDAQAEVRNRTMTEEGMRLGVEFTSPVNWHRERGALPLSGSCAPPALGPGKWIGDRHRLYYRFLTLLERARKKLPEVVRLVPYAQHSVRPGEERAVFDMPGPRAAAQDLPQDLVEVGDIWREAYGNFLRYSLNGFELCEVILDVDGNPVDLVYLETNEAFSQMLGVGDVVGKRVTELWPGIQEDSTFAAFARVALTGESLCFEQFVAPIGKHFAFSAFSPKKGQVAVFLIDITNQKLAESRAAEYASNLEKTNEQLAAALSLSRQALELKREFVNNVSHEMRTPMTAVLGMTDLLLRTSLDEEQREYAEILKTSAGELMRLIEDVLDLSAIHAGTLDLNHGPFSISTLMSRVVAPFETRATAKGLTLAYSARTAGDDHVVGDSRRLSDVLRNLLDNAIKFTEGGGVTLEAHIVGTDAERLNVRFQVQDTGVGIPAERLAHIFEPFVQADGSTTRKYEGAGLGLALSKQLVELMGGEIGLSSGDAGTTVWFVVPLGREQAAAW